MFRYWSVAGFLLSRGPGCCICCFCLSPVGGSVISMQAVETLQFCFEYSRSIDFFLPPRCVSTGGKVQVQWEHPWRHPHRDSLPTGERHPSCQEEGGNKRWDFTLDLFRRGVLWIGWRCGRPGLDPAFYPRQHRSRRRERMNRGGWTVWQFFWQFSFVSDWVTRSLSGIL